MLDIEYVPIKIHNNLFLAFEAITQSCEFADNSLYSYR